jgi:hypothetical protein
MSAGEVKHGLPLSEPPRQGRRRGRDGARARPNAAAAGAFDPLPLPPARPRATMFATRVSGETPTSYRAAGPLVLESLCARGVLVRVYDFDAGPGPDAK